MSAAIAMPGRGRAASRGLLGFCIAQPVGAVALLLVVLLLAAGMFAPLVAPHDPLDVDFVAMLSAPSMSHPAGTDSFGRDVLSRIIYGSRSAIVVGGAAALAGCLAGTAIGVSSAFFGGRIDGAIQRVMDIFLSLPVIVLALVLVAVIGRKQVAGIDLNLILAIGAATAPTVSRVMRSAALGVRQMAYVDAAIAAGFSRRRIIFLHMAPNLAATFLILLTSYIAQAILLEASLSFLGLGVQEPSASWGLMLSGNAVDFFREAPWLVFFPGLAITLTVFAFSLLGDALRDWLDPKLRT